MYSGHVMYFDYPVDGSWAARSDEDATHSKSGRTLAFGRSKLIHTLTGRDTCASDFSAIFPNRAGVVLNKSL